MLTLTSPAFESGAVIPRMYACDGERVSVPLSIRDVPAGAVSLVLIMHDPDIPEAVKIAWHAEEFDHWIVFDMPAADADIKEGEEPKGARGRNTAGELGYAPPCPPDREHRYFFDLYALDCTLNLPEGATRAQVEEAARAHIIERAEFMGRYERE